MGAYMSPPISHMKKITSIILCPLFRLWKNRTTRSILSQKYLVQIVDKYNRPVISFMVYRFSLYVLCLGLIEKLQTSIVLLNWSPSVFHCDCSCPGFDLDYPFGLSHQIILDLYEPVNLSHQKPFYSRQTRHWLWINLK